MTEMRICVRCKAAKQLSAFHFKDQRKGIRHSYCKACQGEYSRAHYRANRAKYLAKARTRNRKKRQLIQQFLADFFAGHHCVDCGEADIRVLEFDHVRGTKRMCVGSMMTATASLAAVKREVKKCVVRCANCHARKTATRGNNWRAKAYVDSTRVS